MADSKVARKPSHVSENTLYEEQENIMVGKIMYKDFKFVLVAEVIIVHANYYKGVKSPDLPIGKIFIHIIVTLIQVLQRQTTGIFF